MRGLITSYGIVCLLANSSIGQSLPPAEELQGNGISVRGLVAHVATKDEYISSEKYSGTSTGFSLSWLRGDTSSPLRLGFDYSGSSALKNNNVSASVIHSGLNLDLLYSLGRFQFFGQTVSAYAGPSAEISLYYRQQNIATGGNALFNAYSLALFFSMGANATFVVPLSANLSIENSQRIALLSLGGRLIDMADKSASFFKHETLFSGIRGYSELLARYRLSSYILLKGGYRFDVFQTTSWDYLISASDGFVLQLVALL